MAMRQTYSRVDNAPESKAESTLEMQIKINNLIMGRCQGLRRSGQTGNRRLTEIGSDRAVEAVPGIKVFQGTIQTVAIQWGDLVKRLAAAAGGSIDSTSKASILSNMPEFEIAVFRRGDPEFGSPSLYAPQTGIQNLSGSGKLISTLIGCYLTNFEVSYNVNEPLIMESCSFEYIDEMFDAQQQSSGPTSTF